MDKINLPEKVFYEIFQYGNENSGYLMYNRYKEQGLEKFKDDLCDIDLWMWEEYWNKQNQRKEVRKIINLDQERNFREFKDSILDNSLYYELGFVREPETKDIIFYVYQFLTDRKEVSKGDIETFCKNHDITKDQFLSYRRPEKFSP